MALAVSQHLLTIRLSYNVLALASVSFFGWKIQSSLVGVVEEVRAGVSRHNGREVGGEKSTSAGEREERAQRSGCRRWTRGGVKRERVLLQRAGGEKWKSGRREMDVQGAGGVLRVRRHPLSSSGSGSVGRPRGADRTGRDWRGGRGHRRPAGGALAHLTVLWGAKGPSACASYASAVRHGPIRRTSKASKSGAYRVDRVRTPMCLHVPGKRDPLETANTEGRRDTCWI
jgi:hypothetical protein